MNKHVTLRSAATFYASTLLSACLYYLLANHTFRENFAQVISLFSCLFIIYLVAWKFLSKNFFNHLIVAGILFRVVLLFSTPNLSDDVYRFIWDGRLAANGINPFNFLPADIISGPSLTGIDAELFDKLNSPSYYSVYPPVLQAIFWLAAKLFPLNVFAAIVFMKTVILLVEIGTVALVILILKKLSLPKENCMLYFLNPLVIGELTGNVHFDGLMIFCIVLSVYLFMITRWKASAMVLGVGIAVKMIPVLFLPLLAIRQGWRKGLLYTVITGASALALFAFIFDSENVRHLLSSTSLFIKQFEFNASLYYVIRWIGSTMKGYNPIATVGPLLYLSAACFIILLSYYRRTKPPDHLFVSALAIITIWYLFSTTVHPWYICLPVAMSVFTNYRFAILWSFTSLFSYYAYSLKPVEENVWLIGAGYFLVIALGIWELYRAKKSVSILTS